MLAIELARQDNQVTLVRAGWQLWDWEDGGAAQLWVLRGECGCVALADTFISCKAHKAVVSRRVIQISADDRAQLVFVTRRLEDPLQVNPMEGFRGK